MQIHALVWPMVGATCFTFGLIHLCMWALRRSRLDFLLFTVACFSVGAIAFCELASMTATTIEGFAFAVRWAHVPVFLLLASLVLFIRYYLGTGRVWLMWLAIGVRGVVLVLSFATEVSINYSAILSLRTITVWDGDQITAAEFVRNPLSHFAGLSSLFVIAFMIDAAVAAWRGGDRRKAILVPGTAIFFIVGVTTHGAFIHAGVLSPPYLISVGYLLIILVIGYELSRDVLRAGDLSQRLALREDELVESEHRMSLAARAASLGLWAWDLPTHRFWGNQRALALYGFGPDELPTASQLHAAIHPEDRSIVRHAADEALRQSGDLSVEYRVALPDGQTHWVATRGQVELDGQGRPARIRGVSVDISDRKLAELEVARGREEIAHLSRVTMLGELSGSIAHELNQPLTAILSNAEAAESLVGEQGLDPAEVREILADIVEQTVRAGEVIRRLRSLLKRGEVVLQPTDINELVREVVAVVRNDTINRAVTMHLELASALPIVDGDCVQLQQVLLNLVVNAFEAMAEIQASGRHLTIRTGVGDEGQVQLCVIDRGPGIPADQREAVFEPFRSTKPAGMGMGLAVSSTIVQAHGGRIWAEPDDDGGTRMCLVLPASKGIPR